MPDKTVRSPCVIAVPCPHCGESAIAIYSNLDSSIGAGGREFSYRSCGHCDWLFSDPLPSPEEIELIYRERYDYEWFRAHRHLKRVQAWHRFRRLRSMLARFGGNEAQPRYIDAGCGHGWLVREAAAAGWSASGLDFLNDAQVADAKANGLDLHSGSLLSHPFSLNSADLVTMWHVLEHMRDPLSALAAAASLLRPQGLLVIAVPNRESVGLARAGEKWGWLQKPFIHPFCFSARSLAQILPPALEVVHVTSRDTWDQQWIQYTPFMRMVYACHHVVFRGARKVALACRLKSLARWAERAHFWANESAQVATYLVYLILRRLPVVKQRYEDALRGSELLLVCRRVSCTDQP